MLAMLITIVAGATIALRVQGGKKTGPRPVPRPARRFRAVSLVPADGVSCCAVCDTLGKRRTLLREAPKLPIAGCLAPECTCRYRHHRDRREFHPGRRLRDVGNFPPLFAGHERRLWDVVRRRRSMRRSARA
jgi:hypothetical protein